MPQNIFVARQPELEQLDRFLTRALDGEGQVCFITGDAGSGKSALAREFCRRAQQQHKDLIATFGQSDAETGIGDPNLPFREILAQFTGNLESEIAQTAITGENAQRLRSFFSLALEALVNVGPDLIGVFLPGAGLLASAGAFAAEKAGWMKKLEHLIQRTPEIAATASTGLEQDHIFEQYTNVLRALAEKCPLILVLDDLHWADLASIGLLFRLGRRIHNNRILIIGTYRPDEVALGRVSLITGQTERHPLDKVLAEFKRYHGEVWIDLRQSAKKEGQHFVDALLDSEPNELSTDFRQALYHHTAGNPLFTIELLRDMQERGDIHKDKWGQWVQGPSLNWQKLPARVEGVVQERIARLDADLHETLTVASVEGETFTAEGVARVKQIEACALIRRLSVELDQRHHLITGQGVRRLESGQRLSLYQFNHNLLQSYLYHNLDEVQRVILHEDFGYILEEMYEEILPEVVFQLARHFVEAGIRDKSVFYLRQAGEQAAAQFAYTEAISYINRAVSLLTTEKDQAEKYELLYLREQIFALQGEREPQRTDLELLVALAKKLDEAQPQAGASRQAEIALRQAAYAEVTGEYQQVVDAAVEAIELANAVQNASVETQGYLFWGRALWRQGDCEMAAMQLNTALDLARKAHLRPEEASSLRYLGIVTARAGDYVTADEHLRAALEIYREIGDRQGQTGTINALGVFSAEQGDFDDARKHFEQTLSVYREIGDRWGEGAALSNLGQVCADRRNYSDARQYLEQALEICAQIDDREGEGTILNNLGQLASEKGDYGAAKDYLTRAASILNEIGNVRTEGFALANLGLVYLHIGDLDRAETYFENGLKVLRIIDDPQGQSLVLAYQALRLHRLGDNKTARDISQEALKIAEKSGSRAEMANALTTLAHAELELGCNIEAAASYHKALDIRQELDQLNLAAEVRAGLARLSLATDDLQLAKTQIDSILAYLETGDLAGSLEPLGVYVTCVQVLQTLQDDRATELLNQAHLTLHQQAYRIQEQELKEKFFISPYATAIQNLKQNNPATGR